MEKFNFGKRPKSWLKHLNYMMTK